VSRRMIPAFSSVLALASACYAGTNAAPEPGEADSTSSAEGTTTAATNPGTTTTPGTSPTAGGTSESSSGTTMSIADDTSTTAGPDMGPTVEPCPATAFCEPFDDYTETALADGQTFGPWRATLSDAGATMDLDGTHTTSGDRALHVRLEQGGTSGGRLFTTDGLPFLRDSPTHVYGRMMMYIAESGTSVHWTFFGVQGSAEPSAPLAGNYAAYIMSSLPADGVNTYSFVDGLSGGPSYQDCWARGDTPMPTGQWTCVSFEMDSLARHLRMYVDDDPAPIVSVDDTGQGCVSPVAGDSLWYGPEIEDMFVGTWSFHPMQAPLEVWIDDLVVDTAPVACP
jgi:hypothetical protein